MTGQTVILASQARRALATSLIRKAPAHAVVNIKPPSRTTDQNAKL